MIRASRRTRAGLLGLLLASLAVPGGAAEPSMAGRWVGAVLFKEGQAEVPMTVELSQAPGGAWSAVLDLPQVGVNRVPISEVKVQGAALALRFDLGDGTGLREIQARGGETAGLLEGTLRQGTQRIPLYLERPPAKPLPPAAVAELANGPAGLKAQFNQDRGKVRLVLLLSPS
jgi:hypothetical protein